AATRTSSAGNNQTLCSNTVSTVAAVSNVGSDSSLSLDSTTANTSRAESSHSILLRAANVVWPTSRATASVSDAAWNLIGVASPETPRIIPTQIRATIASISAPVGTGAD